MNTRTEIKRLGGEGILVAQDIEAFSEAESRIIGYMGDGVWCSASSIIENSGQREGLRRLRNLRSKGFKVDRMRVSAAREFFYRLTREEPVKSTLSQLELPI